MNHRAPHLPGEWRGRLGALPPFPGELRTLDGAAKVTRWLRGNERAVELWPRAPFYVDLNDRVQRQMWMGCYEPRVSRCLSAILSPGDTFLDVGAHIGYHSYFAAGLVGAAGAVHSFEPDPTVFQRLARNLSSFPWAHAQNAAVWHSASSLEFERSFSSSESGWGALTAVRDFSKGEHMRVNALALDEWENTARPGRIDAIKMDAEGAELSILSGAQITLQKFRPPILAEISAPLLKQAGSSASALVSELARLKYRTFVLEYARFMPFTEIPDYHFVDCLCAPEERTEELHKKSEKRGFISSLTVRKVQNH
jgi:FkbM family methyltransferase